MPPADTAWPPRRKRVLGSPFSTPPTCPDDAPPECLWRLASCRQDACCWRRVPNRTTRGGRGGGLFSRPSLLILFIEPPLRLAEVQGGMSAEGDIRLSQWFVPVTVVRLAGFALQSVRCLRKIGILRPLTMETRCSTSSYLSKLPWYSKRNRLKTRSYRRYREHGKKMFVFLRRIICSRCSTRRNLRFHVANSQHADKKQLTRR